MNIGRSVIPDRKGRRDRPSHPATVTLVLALFALPVLAACTPTVVTHGHSLDEEQIAKINPGATSRQEVLQLMGSPSSLSNFDDKAWYYVSQRTEKKSFYQEGVVDQEVVTVSFDDGGLVTAIDRHGLDQVASIEPVDRVTPTAGSSPTIMQQLISNIGRFSNSAEGIDPDL